jgi:hypothetical protein
MEEVGDETKKLGEEMEDVKGSGQSNNYVVPPNMRKAVS